MLNLLLQDEGYQLVVHEIATLQHLGGVSMVPIERRNAGEQRPKPWQRQFGQRLRARAMLCMRRLWQADYYRFSFSKRRAAYKVYFHDLLIALRENSTLPTVPQTGDLEIENRISCVTQEIKSLYQWVQYENSLPGPSVLSPSLYRN